MATVVRRTVRRTPIPVKSSSARSGGFFQMLSKLNEASDRLNRSRPRRRS